MFRKLHFKLTVYNAIILIIFLIVFSAIVYIFMKEIIYLRVDQGLHRAAYGAVNLKPPPPKHFVKIDKKSEDSLPPVKESFLVFFIKKIENEKYPFAINYILRDNNLQIIATNVTDDAILARTLKIAQTNKDANEPHYTNFEQSQDKMRLLTMLLDENGNNNIVQVYTNINRELAFLSNLMLILFTLGILSVIVLVTIGRMLAGKSLVPIKKSWQQQKRFIADVSHELRTPLTVIQTNLDILFSNHEETIGSNIKWLENIKSEAGVMSKLVNDLLLLTRVDANQMELKKEIIDLSVILTDTVHEMEPLFKGKDINIFMSIKENVKHLGDELRIRQLFRILLDNAYKFTPAGGKVWVKLETGRDNIFLSVTDTGVGISSEDKGRIFDRFYRADKARAREQGGSGLGLSIADWIVKEHNGKIEVDSMPGKGSSFTVVLPLLPDIFSD